MKVRNLVGALFAATTLGVSVAVVTPGTSAQAKAKPSLKALPKSIRGTWYHYEENDGYYYQTLKLGAQKATYKNAFDAYGNLHKQTTLNLHVLKNARNAGSTYSRKYNNWMYAIAQKGGYTELSHWNFGFTYVGYGQYKVMHKNYRGKSVKVLYNKEVKDHLYQTKAQAKFFNPVGALHK